MATATTAAATAATQQQTASLPAGRISMPGVLAWFSAWAIVLGVLYGISKTKWGHTIVYYVLWLGVVLVVVSHSSTIAGILQQGNITQGQS